MNLAFSQVVYGYNLSALLILMLQEDGCRTLDLLYTILVICIQW